MADLGDSELSHRGVCGMGKLNDLAGGGVLGTSRVPTLPADCAGQPLKVTDLGETQRSLPSHTHNEGPAAAVRLLHTQNLKHTHTHTHTSR